MVFARDLGIGWVESTVSGGVMSNTVRRSPVRDVLEELNLARIAAIATTISIHIVAFGFLMVPIALPDMVRSLPSVTEVTFVMPPLPQPVVPPAPIQPARPETMPRAAEKAKAEMKPGAWLVSLEFEAAELKATAVTDASPNRTVWLYQAPFTGQSRVTR